jgi:hypothetical protein
MMIAFQPRRATPRVPTRASTSRPRGNVCAWADAHTIQLVSRMATQVRFNHIAEKSHVFSVTGKFHPDRERRGHVLSAATCLSL